MPRFTVIVFIFLGFSGLFSDIIANVRPLWCNIEGVHYFPAFRSIINRGRIDYGDPNLKQYEENNSWQLIPANQKLMPLIKFAGNIKTVDKSKRPLSKSSSEETHWLGTDPEGRDVLAALLAGARTALLTGSIAILLSLFVGGILGGIAGYFGDTGATATRGMLVALATGTVAALFFTLISRKSIFSAGGLRFMEALLLFAGITVVSILAGRLLAKIPVFAKKVVLPLDLLILRLAEIFSAVPMFIVLLTVSAMLVDRSLMNMIVLIGLLSWPGTALFLRAELLKIRQMEYITAARGLGLPEWRILWHHAVPNAIRPVMVAFALGTSSAVLLEAGIAFLNIGNYSMHQITWGQLLQTARGNIELWWVWLPPGIVICLLVGALFEWSERLNR